MRNQIQRPTQFHGKSRVPGAEANRWQQSRNRLAGTSASDEWFHEWVQLTPEVDDVQVNDELDDLHGSQVLLPLQKK
jgi:hypothetical protein